MQTRYGGSLGALVAGLLGSTVLALPAFAQTAPAAPAPAAATMVTQEMLENPKPEEWILVHQNYAAHRFSPLKQITADNIKNLTVAYTMAVSGVEGGGSRYANASLEGTPLVEGGYMYYPNGWGVVYKLDLSDPMQGRYVWMTDPQVDKPWAGDVACCGINNRSVALWQDKIITSALDGRMLALNKATGEVLWERKVADPALGETITISPLVINDIAIVGPAGAEYGIRGWLDGTDLNTGQQKWRTFTVAGPDEPGGETWVNKDNLEPYKNGGGSIWVTGTYDPELHLTYWGTGNPGPDFDAEYRPGDNLYTDSALALNPDDGKIVWYFQYTPNDPFDYDEISEHPLIDVEVDGQMRKLAVHSGRNGYFYGFDRATGAFVYGKQYVNEMSWTPGLDPKTGKPLSYDPAQQVQAYVKGSVSRRDGAVGTFCPLVGGGKNWEPSAYNPDLKLIYVAGGEGCQQRVTKIETGPVDKGGTWKPRDRFVGGGAPDPGVTLPPPENPEWKVYEKGSLAAIDVTTGDVKHKVQLDFVNRAGMLATAGNWVMTAEPDGWIRAFKADDLTEIWRYNVGASVKAPPISYQIGDTQWVAIMVGAAPATRDHAANPMLKMFAPSHLVYFFKLPAA